MIKSKFFVLKSFSVTAVHATRTEFVLSKAFRGELGTNDHDDEPAIELLKRSLKEKAKANQNPKTILPRQNRESEVFHGK